LGASGLKMSKASDAIMMAREVMAQGGNIDTLLGGNCPSIGEVICRALSDPYTTLAQVDTLRGYEQKLGRAS
jgi:hypothetical protein